MAAHHEKANLIELACQIDVGIYEIPDLDGVRPLRVERHGGRLVGESGVFRVPVHVEANLHFSALNAWK